MVSKQISGSVQNQYLAALIVNLMTIGFGVFDGWASPSVILLISDESPLPSGKITMEEASWVTSLMSIGALTGIICFGCIINNFGRKLPLIFIALPMILSWLLIWFSQNVIYLYVGRLLGGFFAGAAYMIVPIYLSEIASDRVRGSLLSLLVFAEDTGILLAFIIGNFAHYYAIPIFSIGLMTLLAISFSYLPESPLFLVKQNKIDAAEKSIQFYQNLQATENDRKLLEIEISKLKCTLSDDESKKCQQNGFRWTDLTTGVARKAILIGIVLVALNQFSGSAVMISYSSIIFQEAESNLSPNVSSMIVAIIQLIGTFSAGYLVDRSGRRLLMAISTIGAALGLMTLGVYMMLKSWHVNVSSVNWMPLVSFSFVIYVSSLGISSLPLVIIPEIMPERIKDAGVSFCLILLFAFSFTATKLMPELTAMLGFHGTMFLFAGICLLGTIFFMLVLPETKGKSYQEIQNSLQ